MNQQAHHIEMIGRALDEIKHTEEVRARALAERDQAREERDHARAIACRYEQELAHMRETQAADTRGAPERRSSEQSVSS